MSDPQRTPRPPSAAALPTPDLRAGRGPTRSVPVPEPEGDDALVGETVAGYVLIEPIGEGGMGRVFLAHDKRLDRQVALKLLPPGDADDEARARFLREARALARVEHPNVVAVHASGVDNDVAWMALEYIEGEPLDAILAAGPLDEETALLLAAQAARGLAAVHEVGVVHRDVKPANLLLDEAGALRVVDFGVAYFTEQRAGGGFVTQAGVAIGTPHFMAPEQARGGTVDGRADAWGLGATLFMMLAGTPPFMNDENEEEGDLDILARVLREPVPDLRTRAPGVSAETAAVVRRLLARKREDRLSDLLEIADLLEACADHLEGGPMPVIEAPGKTTPEPSAAGRVEAPAPTERADRAPSTSSLWRQAGVWSGAAAVILLAVAAGWLLAANEPRAEAPRVGPPVPPANNAPEVVEDKVATVEAPPEEATAPTEPTPLPSPDELAEKEAEGLVAAFLAGEGSDAALTRLVELQSAPAERAVLELVSSSNKASEVMDRIGRLNARHHLSTLTAVLVTGSTARAVRAAQTLAELRSAESLAPLLAAEQGHSDPAVRAAAKKARRTIFSVEGETDDSAPTP